MKLCVGDTSMTLGRCIDGGDDGAAERTAHFGDRRASGIGRATAALFAPRAPRSRCWTGPPMPPRLWRARLVVIGVVSDVADPASVDAAVDAAAAALGGLDGVVNAAGILSSSGIAETAPEVFARTLAVNLTGTFLVVRAALRFLQARRRRRSSISDRALGLLPTGPGSIAYVASKGGVHRNEQGDGDGIGAGNPRERGLPRPGGDRDDRRLPAQRGG